MKILVTGGAGFIGSAVVRHLIAATDWEVVNVDALTYAGNLESVAPAANNPRYRFEQVDIRERQALDALFERDQPDAVMHLAAESHVDRSIDSPAAFVETNVLGTYHLLEAALQYRDTLDGPRRERFRFHHVSTDEVFGALGRTGRFTEETPYRPNSPYAASKASSDHLVRAWCATYGLPVVLSNCSNNYGPYQYPEKLIPLAILRASEGRPVPVYGRGKNVRDWLYVEDHVTGLLAALRRGRIGESYNIGGNSERTNLEVVQNICWILDDVAPDRGGPHEGLIEFVKDRPGHDFRYAIDASRIRRELGWTPRESFDSGLRRTVEWYLANGEWCARALEDKYAGERLGLGRSTQAEPSDGKGRR